MKQYKCQKKHYYQAEKGGNTPSTQFTRRPLSSDVGILRYCYAAARTNTGDLPSCYKFITYWLSGN